VRVAVATMEGPSASKRVKLREGAEEEMDVPIEGASICPVCLQMGVELKYRTRVPWFRGGTIITLKSFDCQSCQFSNKECSPVGAAPAKGVRCCLRVPKGAEGLVHQKRELIKSEFASLEIPEIGFEMPARTDKGIMWSIEKVLETARRNLRTMLGGDSGEEIGAFLNKLEDVMYGDCEWSLVVDDPSGNSFIEPNGSVEADQVLTVEEYEPTEEQRRWMTAGQ